MIELKKTGKERFDEDRKFYLKEFLKKFKKLQHPNCYICSSQKGDRFIKVDKFEVNYDPHRHEIYFQCHCHKDLLELRGYYETLMKLDQIDTRMVFKPNQGYRQDKKLITTISRRRKDDDTHAY